MRDAVVAVLLVVGVAAQLLACFGVLVARGPYNRLHYTGPTALGAIAIGLAVLVHESFSLIGDRALEVAFLIAFTSPAIVQAIARAARVSERGSLDVEGDDVEVIG
jgi:monovalent cation/proton antiporter MnhG/PhaG subunit